METARPTEACGERGALANARGRPQHGLRSDKGPSILQRHPGARRHMSRRPHGRPRQNADYQDRESNPTTREQGRGAKVKEEEEGEESTVGTQRASWSLGAACAVTGGGGTTAPQQDRCDA